MNEKPRIYVIGLGVKIPDHTTAQAKRALACCDRIFTIVQESPSLWIPADVPKRVVITNLLEEYIEGVLRTDNYDRAADLVLSAVQADRTVGYVTYGNPLAYDSVAQKLVRTAQQTGIQYDVVPGISSIDTMLCDLGVDMAPGIQVYEASWLLAAEIRLDVSVAVILLQISNFGSLRAHYQSRPDANSLAPLAEYLCRFYPATHEAFLVRSAGGFTHRSNIRGVALSSLCTVATEDLLNCSMFIGPLERSRLNQEFIETMRGG